MEAAAVLLSLAMRDTEHPVADLCDALTRIGGSLAEWRRYATHGPLPVTLPVPDSAPAGATALAPSSAASSFRAQLESDVAVCIQSLQFHDRLIQQLAAVRGLLASVVNDADPVPLNGFGAHRWEEMLQVLRERLSADSQHHLFTLLLRTGVVDLDGRRNLHAEDGSVELF